MSTHAAVYTIERYKIELGVMLFILNATLLLPFVFRTERVGSENHPRQSVISARAVEPVQNRQTAAAPQPTTAQISPTRPPIAPVWPVRGRVTTEFGAPHMPWQRMHTGIDITSGYGSGIVPVASFGDGTVAQAIHSYRGYGNHVIVNHGNGISSLYAHLSSVAVQVGQRISQGSTIGYEGNTGASTGTHLHFEIRQHNVPVNPRMFFNTHP